MFDKSLQVPWVNGYPFVFATKSNIEYNRETIEWRENKPFITNLTFLALDGSSSNSIRARFRDEKSGIQYTMLARNFERAIPHLVNGILSGRFCFQKQGSSYGIKFLQATPLELLAASADD